MSDFNLKGGVLVIGSLYWDPEQIRVDWRSQYLDMTADRKLPLPIRYGRLSGTRLYTHTMVFSSECKTKPGHGYVIPFNNIMEDLKAVDAHVMALMRAEHNGDPGITRYNWGWGVVGLAVNPVHLAEGSDTHPACRQLEEHWAHKIGKGFKPEEYRVGKEDPIMDQQGRLLIDWPEELKGYDFVIATAIKPELRSYPQAEEIAIRMRYNHYPHYFRENVAHGISTTQDTDIAAFLNIQGVDILNYLARVTVPVVVFKPGEGMPEGHGSGCMINYKGKRFLLSVEHVTNLEGCRIGIQTGLPSQNGHPRVYMVGAPWNFDLYKLPKKLPRQINTLEDLGGVYDDTLDITFCELKEDVLVIQSEFTYNGQPIYKGPKYILDLDKAGTPEPGKLYGFTGNIRHRLSGSMLFSRPTFKLDLEYRRTQDRYHYFEYPQTITDANDFRGCSGAPILDEEGKLVALVTGMYSNTNRLRGFSIEACKDLLDMAILYEEQENLRKD